MNDTQTDQVSKSPRSIAGQPAADAERKAALDSFFGELQSNNAERRQAVQAAVPALDRLCAVMSQSTNQSYRLRALLYSLYNGAPRSLLDIVTLDWSLQKDLCAVLLAFGFEDRDPLKSFYYEAFKAAVEHAGLWAWFIAEGEVAA